MVFLVDPSLASMAYDKVIPSPTFSSLSLNCCPKHFILLVMEVPFNKCKTFLCTLLCLAHNMLAKADPHDRQHYLKHSTFCFRTIVGLSTDVNNLFKLVPLEDALADYLVQPFSLENSERCFLGLSHQTHLVE